MPAALIRPAERDHMVGEYLAEAGRFEHRRTYCVWHPPFGRVQVECDLRYSAGVHHRSSLVRARLHCPARSGLPSLPTVRSTHLDGLPKGNMPSLWQVTQRPAVRQAGPGSTSRVTSPTGLPGQRRLAGYSLDYVVAYLGRA